ncbi:hypothetical protein [Actinocorallia herbida]|nr:hypothetical protein [Actinocorallia herbida]
MANRARSARTDAAVALGAVAPALVHQSAADPSGAASLALGGYAVVAVAALTVRRRAPVAICCLVFAAFAATEAATSVAGVSLSALTLLPVAVALSSAGVAPLTGWAVQRARTSR